MTQTDQVAALRRMTSARRRAGAVACTRSHGGTGARTAWENIGINLCGGGRTAMLLPLAYGSFWNAAPAASPEPEVLRGHGALLRLDSPYRPAPDELEPLMTGRHPLAAGADYVLLECGYGSSGRAAGLLGAANAVLLAFTCDSSSVLATYDLMKRCCAARRAAGLPDQAWLLLATMCPSALAGEQALSKFSAAASRFLGLKAVEAGALPLDPRVKEAAAAGMPACVLFPSSPYALAAAAAAGNIARHI